MDLVVSTLAERPEAEAMMWGLSREWPEFLLEDPTANYYFADVERVYPEYVLVAWDAVDPGTLLARAFSVPFRFGEDVLRTALPSAGWSGVVRWAHYDRVMQRRPTHVAALEVTVASSARGRGVSARMVEALRDNSARLGFEDLVVPVRPTGNAHHPTQPLADYAERMRDDGLPEDDCLRVHLRAGGRIVGLAPTSLTISGTLDQWRQWTGEPFDTHGMVVVPGALAPVFCDQVNEIAVYVEPNVWVHHSVRAPADEPGAYGG